MREPLIAGFGFATIGQRQDLADLDRALGRIEDAGASHAELELFAADLIAGEPGVAGGRGAAWSSCAPGAGCATRRTARSASTSWTSRTSIGTRRSAGPTWSWPPRSGPPWWWIHPGFIPVRPAQELDRLHAVERAAWREMGDLAGSLGMRIAVETLFVESDRDTPPTRFGWPRRSRRPGTRMSSVRSTSATAT